MLKRDVKLQPTNHVTGTLNCCCCVYAMIFAYEKNEMKPVAERDECKERRNMNG